MRRIKGLVLAGSFISSFAAVAAHAQQATDDSGEDISQIIVTGTRVADRSALDTAVPVDVVRSEALVNSGITEVNQALSTALPSFNFPRPGLADGSDTIRRPRTKSAS